MEARKEKAEWGMGTRRRPIGRNYAAAKDAEGGKGKSEVGMRKGEKGIRKVEFGMRNSDPASFFW